MFSWFKKKAKLYCEEIQKETKYNFNDTDAEAILDNIKNEYGLDYTKQKDVTLRKIERFAIKNGLESFDKLKEKIAYSLECKEALINMLTVGETYFYREMGHFRILADMFEKKSSLRILCAPSSTGEESYSIILYLQEKLGNVPAVDIVGIDINTEAITKARNGCFTQRAVSLLPRELLKKSFVLQKESYCIKKEYRHFVSFFKCNVFDKEALRALGMFDVVFCRNMLIYFDDVQKKQALENLRSVLLGNGLLFTGHADLSFVPSGYKKQISKYGSYFIKLNE